MGSQFTTVAMAWQIAFLVIGFNPVRFRPLIIPAVIEKIGYVLVLAVLHSQGRIPWADAQAGVPDFILGLLFIVAYVKTRV